MAAAADYSFKILICCRVLLLARFTLSFSDFAHFPDNLVRGKFLLFVVVSLILIPGSDGANMLLFLLKHSIGKRRQKSCTCTSERNQNIVFVTKQPVHNFYKYDIDVCLSTWWLPG